MTRARTESTALNAPRSEDEGQLALPWIDSAEPADGARDIAMEPEGLGAEASAWVLDMTVDEFDPPGTPAVHQAEPVAPDPVGSPEPPRTLSAALDEIFGPEPEPVAAPVAPRPQPQVTQSGNGHGGSPTATVTTTTISWSFGDQPRVSEAEAAQPVDWEHVHIAMPRLLGQPAYTPPRRFFVPSERPFDPDELPLNAERRGEDSADADGATEALLARAQEAAGMGFRLAPETLRSLGAIFRRRQ